MMYRLICQCELFSCCSMATANFIPCHNFISCLITTKFIHNKTYVKTLYLDYKNTSKFVAMC